MTLPHVGFVAEHAWAEAADGLGGSADHSEAHWYWRPGAGMDGSGGA